MPNARNSAFGTAFVAIPFSASRRRNSTFAGWSSGASRIFRARPVSVEDHDCSFPEKKPMQYGSSLYAFSR